MSFLEQLHQKFFGVSGAGRPCKKKAYFYDVYPEGGEWFFTWYTENHTEGELRGPYRSQEVANMMQTNWARTIDGITQHA
jgi:hypothetical protein